MIISKLQVFKNKFGLRNIAFLLYLFSLMFPMNLTTAVLILYTILFIFEKTSSVLKNFNYKAYLLAIVPVIIILISFLGPENNYYIIKELEKNLTFLLLPLFVISDYKILQQLTVQLFLSIFLGLLVLMIFSIFLSLISPGSLSLFDYLELNFDNLYLTNYIGIHHAYFSLLLSISILSILFLFNKIKINKLFLVATLIFASIYNFLLMARTSFVIFCFLLFAFLIYKNRKYFYLMLIVGALVYFSADKNSFTFNRLTSSADISKRFKLNSVSWGIFLEYPFFGAGPEHIGSERLIKYEKINFTAAYKHLYNSHNQYLEYLSVYGVFGFLLFITSLIYMIIISLKRKQILILFPLILFAGANLTESYLVRNKGIVIFSFIISIFIIYNMDIFRNKCQKSS